MLDAIKAHPAVHSTKIWEGKNGAKRTYINLVGKIYHFRGDQSYQCYYDHKTGKLFMDCGSGTRSSDFCKSVDALKEFRTAWIAGNVTATTISVRPPQALTPREIEEMHYRGDAGMDSVLQ